MKIWNEIWDYVKMIIIVVVVVLVVNNVVLINAKIPSESMENTIMTGDRIFGFRMAYGLISSSSNFRMMKASCSSNV